ncbi:MAG: hypothetical protein D6681_17520 [Calditrichaeota bacterium]|nr:MAG: hypothetical protein D6681_17520 [Calditrichota bacterium]
MGFSYLLPQQADIVTILGGMPEFRQGHFYLAGGAGLIFHLGHRQSPNLDFFTCHPFCPDDWYVILTRDFRADIRHRRKGSLRVHLDGYPCNFYYYPFPLLDSLLAEGLPLASLLDIGCMKLRALLSRQRKQDWVDLYQISQRISWERLWESYQIKYRSEAEQLIRLTAQLEELHHLDEDYTYPSAERHWPAAKAYFAKIRTYLNQQYGD